MPDDSVVLLSYSREKSGHVYKRDNRDVEAIAEADKSCGLCGGVDIQASSKHLRLVGHHSNAAPVEPGKTDDDVLCEMFLHFEKGSRIDNRLKHFQHVVRFVWMLGDDRVEGFRRSQRIVVGLAQGGILEVVRRKISHQRADEVEGMLFGLCGKVGHPACLVVGHRAAKLLGGHLLMGHRTYHIGAGHKHVACGLGHHGEIRDRRRIHRASGTWA